MKPTNVFVLDGQSGAGKDSIAFALNCVLFAKEEDNELSYKEMKEHKEGFVSENWISNYSITRLAMADVLKTMTAEANGEKVHLYYDQKSKDEVIVDFRKKRVTRRQCLIDNSQLIKDERGENFFVNSVIEEAKWAIACGRNVVITDCRFDFEMELIENAFGSWMTHIHVISPDSKRHDMDDLIDRSRFKPHVVWYNQKNGEMELIEKASMLLQNEYQSFSIAKIL